MKTYKNLFEKVHNFENLYEAYKKARRGKRYRPDVNAFTADLESELIALEDELRSGSYCPGKYHQFYIREPKRRLISAAPFRDRVVHHAICRIIEPIFEARFIYDSYACRIGKGTHRAVRRFKKFLALNRYILKCDIRKYFSSIDHNILIELLGRRIADKKLMELIALSIDHSPPDPESKKPVWFPGDNLLGAARRRGIPIGNLTSQFFSNVYLHELDKFVKFERREKYYIRYCDDFVTLGTDKKHLHELKTKIEEFLQKLRLRLHPKKSLIFPKRVGTDFLGYRIYPTHTRVRKSNTKRFVQRTRKLQEAYAKGEIPIERVSASIHSWIGHVQHADSWNLRKKLFDQFDFKVERTALCP